MSTKRTGAVLIAVLTLLMGACSSDDGGDDDGADADGSTTTAGSDSTTAGDGVDAPAPELTAGECPFEAPTELQGEIRCGTVAVPVDHDDPSGDMIDIAVAVYPVQPAPEGGSGSSTTTTEAGATEESVAASDPLFYLAGGPGQKAVAQVQLLASVAPALLEREVVIMDQRGIGESDPALDCPELDEVAVDPGAEDEVVRAATEECHTALAEETDLSAYGTPANAADIDLVRQALDYEQINLMGTSYGSRLALEYARDHSDSLRSLVLNSPVPTDTSYFEDVPQNSDDALSALIAACEADVECARDNPDLDGSVEEALQRSEQAPEIAIEDPASGETVTVRATTAFVSYALFNTMYIGALLGGMPQAITAAGAGDFAPLFQAAALTINPGGTSTGMFLSNVCAEGISLVDIDELEDEAADVSSYAATQAVSLAKIVEQCEVWDVEAAPDAAFEPVSTDVPTLIVTGAFDPITPTSYGEAVEDDLSEATLVEVSAAGHDPLTTTPEPECGQMILVEFLTDPSAEVDDGCATEATLVFGPMAEALEALIGSQQPQGGG